MAAETIGERLRQTRLSKHISIDELQQMTKVQKRYLIAIEEDDFESLPGTYYVRAFIRQYAQAVGEDGDLLVAVFDGKEPMPGTKIIERPQPVTVSESRKAIHQEEQQARRFLTNLPAILLTLVALAIITVVGYMTWQNHKATPIIGSADTTTTIESETAESTTVQETTTTEEVVEETKPEPIMTVVTGEDTGEALNLTLNDAENPIKLDFTANNRVWVGVRIGGSYVYQYTLAANETQSFQLPDKAADATIVLGVSEFATVKANGIDIPINPTVGVLDLKNLNLTINYR